jgi:chromosome segregation ATPase
LDPSQATRLLTWLDDEHRKDKALLIELQSQVSAQAVQLVEQSRQFQDIQATLTRIEGQLPRISQLEGAAQGIRGEFASLLSKHTADEEAHVQQRLDSDKQSSETLARMIRAVQERVESLGTFDSTIAVLREEDSKLRSELTKAFIQLADVSRAIREKAPMTDALSREIQMVRDGLSNLQTSHQELADRTLSIRPAIDNVAVRLDSRTSQLETAATELDSKRAAEVEALQRKQTDLVRQIEALAAELHSSQAPLTRWSQQLDEFTAEFESNRKTLYDLNELEKQMRQQGAELVELLRIAAERQRTILREWQDSQVLVDEQQTARLDQLEAAQTKVFDTVEGLRSSQERTQKDVVAYADELWRAWSDYMQAQSRLLDSSAKQRRNPR